MQILRRPARLLLALASLVLVLAGGGVRADVIEMKDGTKYDGRVIKEDAQFLWIKTIVNVEKVAVENVKSRTPGESDVDRWEKLQAAAQKEPVTAAALWDMYVFCKAHAKEGLDKELKRLLPRILKLDPNHPGARGEVGDVLFEGQWVKKSDLARLEAERAREKLRNEWQQKLKVPVEIYQADHFLLVDNMGSKDLPLRAKQLDKAYDVVCHALGVEKVWDDPLPVITIKTYDDFCRVLDYYGPDIPKDFYTFAKDKACGGLWRHRPVRFILRWPNVGADGMWSAIIHNAAHTMVWTLWPVGKEPPTWLDEGIGATTEIEVMGQQLNSCCGRGSKPPEDPPKGGTSDNFKKKKKDPKKNAQDLREAENEFKQKLIDALNADEFPAMRKFLAYKLGDFGPAEEGAAIGLVTWFMKLDQDKFHELFKSLVAGAKRSQDEYYRDTYGFDVIETMETKWKAWVLGEW